MTAMLPLTGVRGPVRAGPGSLRAQGGTCAASVPSLSRVCASTAVLSGPAMASGPPGHRTKGLSPNKVTFGGV